MTPYFHPRLVNGPFQDPVLYIDCLYRKRALLFDIGDITALSARHIHKITDIFVSHTHMDHFIGLDHIFRLFLGRDKYLTIYGPTGIIANVAGKLSAYTWNLVENYGSKFEIRVLEVLPDHLKYAMFRCHMVFKQEILSRKIPFSGLLMDEDDFSIRAELLDHNTPCLAFSLEEKFHINIQKDKLDILGLPVGPWLNQLKTAIRQEESNDYVFEISGRCIEGFQEKQTSLGWLKDQGVFSISHGQKIVYVVDIGYTPDNISRLIPFVMGADYLFCEAAFLEKDRKIADKKHHLTAHQAGLIARKAKVRKLIPFHFSPRYQDQSNLLYQEAEQAFGGENFR
jgi:ribonuclease Z